MSRPRSLTILGLLAVGLAAAAPTSASAEPEFLTKAVVGEAVTSVPFNGTLGATFWEGKVSRSKLTCAAGTIGGEVTGARTLAKTVLTLTGCESGGCKIQTKGHAPGEVVSPPLAGKLNGITATLPGIKLFSEAEGKGGVFFEWELCGVAFASMTGEITGSLAGAAGEGPSTGKLLTKLKLTFAESGGSQKYQGFGEGPEAGLKGQLTDTINGVSELAGLSQLSSSTTVPATWGLGITR